MVDSRMFSWIPVSRPVVGSNSSCIYYFPMMYFTMVEPPANVQLLYICSLPLLHRNPDLVRRIGAATALEVRATGISYTFAPCLAVNTCCLYPKTYVWSNISLFVLVVSLIYNSLFSWKLSFRFVGTRGGGGVMKATVRIQKLCKKWLRL